jgi:SAM-dependent methyltransferase
LTAVSRALKSTEEWRALARTDSLLAIAYWPDKEQVWEQSDFYASGQSDWDDFLRHWQHYSPELGGTCVEIGSGAGRITRALAGHFERVIGLDVSPDMHDLARAAIPGNVELVLVDSTDIPREDASVDAVFSTHVLQHLDDLDAVSAYLREASRVLRPGGTVMVHVPLPGTPMSMRGRLWLELQRRRNRRALARGSQQVQASTSAYGHDEMRAALAGAGLTDVELRVFPVRSNGDPHPFWFGRRA